MVKKDRFYEYGFTFIELLVVMVVLISTGIVIGAILFSSLRGASKASILTLARQNGNYAISQMEKTIRNAKSFGGVSGDCDPDNTDSTNPCKGDWITDCSQSPITTPYKYVNITTLDGEKIVFSCKHNDIYSNDNSLVDTSDTNKNSAIIVDQNSCIFTCMQNSPSDSPTIGIKFSITQSQTNATSENSVSLPFSSSVKMRNSIR